MLLYLAVSLTFLCDKRINMTFLYDSQFDLSLR